MGYRRKEPPDQVLGQNLRQLMKREKTMRSAADNMGIHHDLLSTYVNGYAMPRLDNLLLICQYFQVDARIAHMPLDQIECTKHKVMDAAVKTYSKSAHYRVDEPSWRSAVRRIMVELDCYDEFAKRVDRVRGPKGKRYDN